MGLNMAMRLLRVPSFAEPIVAERLGAAAATRLLDMLDRIEDVPSVSDVLAATRPAR
jgi:hypothetical protein